jgi:hypothetical protein
MKRNPSKPSRQTDKMRKTYDFSAGIRGKHAQAMQAGYTIRIHAPDGTVSEKQVPPRSLVSLEPDVQAFFPDSEAVNHALRTLIELLMFQLIT